MATTRYPAAEAERSPLLESSIATDDVGAAPRREAARRYASGAGLPLATSSLDATAPNASASPARSSTMWMIAGGDELATPSGHRSPMRRTASTAPGMSGRGP